MNGSQESLLSAGRWLAMDTSTGNMTIGLVEQGRPVAEYSSEAERNHSLLLLPAVDRLLEEQGVLPADLAGIAVGRGPGSYTGVRIAISVAKTMAWALELPVLGVSGLEAMALGAWEAEAGREDGAASFSSGCVWYVPLLDARRRQAFTGLYAWERGVRRSVAPDGIRLVPDWLEQLEALADQEEGRPDRIVFIGETDGFSSLLEPVAARSPERVRIVPRTIGAAVIGALAWERFERGERDDVHTLIPNYTQLAEAEVKLLQREREQAERGGDSL